MKKIILLIILLALGIGAYYGFTEYNRGLEGATKVDHATTCTQLFEDYETDEKAANEKYLEKTIEVTGVIQEVSKNEKGINITLEGGMLFGVTCEMFESEKLDQNKYKKGQKITLKGICAGYLSDVILVRCVESS